MFFGCLELAEQFHVVPETAAEEQERQDLDEEALSQLASGLKSDIPNLGAPGYASVTRAVADTAFSISVDPIPQVEWRMLHNPPSRPLYQPRSVYRI